MTVKEYTEEFYRVNLRASYTDDTPEKNSEVREWLEDGNIG